MLVISLIRKTPITRGIAAALIKCMFLSFTPRQAQAILPTSRATYKTWVEAKAKTVTDPELRSRLKVDVQPLASGLDSAILWVGDRSKAKRVVVFFHGGGFVFTLSPGHVAWCWNSYVADNINTDHETAVAILQYTVAPDGPFPTQMVQAVAAVRQVIDLGFSPSDILIGGDSAGGNLTMQVLAHLLHPHPSSDPLLLKEPLAGAFIVSPWVGRDTTAKSFADNSAGDMISIAVGRSLCSTYVTRSELSKCEVKENGWIMALDSPAGWFGGLEKVVSSVYVTVGVDEALADQGRQLSQIISTQNPTLPLRLEEFAKDIHDGIFMENTVGIEGQGTRAMKAWYQKVINKD